MRFSEKLVNVYSMIKSDRDGDMSFSHSLKWPVEKQSSIIDSILINIPLQTFFCRHDELNSQYKVIDGEKRLASINNFVDNSFPFQGSIYYPGLRGKYYNDFPAKYRRIIDSYILTFCIISEASDEELRDIVMKLKY